MNDFVNKLKPKNCIDNTEAMEMREHWVNTRAKAIDNDLGFTDTRDFVWSVEELEEYLAYVKRKSISQGIENPGIRVSLAAYKDSNNATLFFSPTIGTLSNSENNYKIESFNKGNGGWPPNDFGD